MISKEPKEPKKAKRLKEMSLEELKVHSKLRHEREKRLMGRSLERSAKKGIKLVSEE